MALTDPVDIYCERLDPGFWAEPLNAASNIAFIVAALIGAAMLVRRGNRDVDLWLLVALTAAVGVGSFLFHTFATVWAGLADTIPIWVFVAVFVAVAMWRYFAMGALRIANIPNCLPTVTNAARPAIGGAIHQGWKKQL